MYELLNDILQCIEFVSRSVMPNLAEIVETWDRCSQLYAGVVDKINVAWRAPLDTEFLEEFPDIRTKVAKKLEWLGNDQLSVLRLLIGRMFNINECLKIKLDRINIRLEQISFEEHNELKHSVREHVMWIEDCWTCLHCFYMQLDFAMMSLIVSDEESASNLVKAIQQDEKDKSTIGKSQIYMQSCLSLIKFLSNKTKIKQFCL
ncbi:uncharacterized protein LOC100160766 [Acyrthosiphon pisum]|uniref:ACYPI002037 protein n=1 Tax=Acyrthosiphon pisum TaxID=7029 RepID=C4WXG9_ACYPI|nr:uncharacterized protein LOC100160766 [Acyrthosiphon pisum]BAH72589.1 ACYPI002037 [Acyrthosiphon pisum]|eukprot:NP_001233122.1 uncharacterized protein LOC100160766 [Acyrthosiphon pisum]